MNRGPAASGDAVARVVAFDESLRAECGRSRRSVDAQEDKGRLF
jgi:hypothetical protein